MLFLPVVFFSFVISDFIIGTHSTIFFTWGSILIISLISTNFYKDLKSRSLGVLLSLMIFYIITNFGVWLTGQYTHSIQGLILCYVNALPFFGNTVISTILYSFLIEVLIYKYIPEKKVSANI